VEGRSSSKDRPFCASFKEWHFFREFCHCQCWLIVCVIFASHDRSLTSSKISAVAKNLMPFGGGLRWSEVKGVKLEWRLN
jgi:hypothetical protein